MESRRAVAREPGVRVYCTGCGAVREGKRLFLCRVVVVLWLGRCGECNKWVVNPPARLPWIAQRQAILGFRAGVSTPC